ncbi:MAG: hypothetical protein O7G85_07895 [Planctomycetota bacterium]|nr:hypothetical protein [Planctomycetota bacterium]
MNSDFMRWLLDLDVIPRDADQTLRLAWEHPWASWVWTLLFMVVGLFAFWSYTRLVGGRKSRGAMAMSRALLILLVLVVISGPMLELPRESIEEDWVLVLVDRSESMQIQDAGSSTGRISRDQQLRSILESHAEMLQELSEEKQLVYLGFHFGAFDLNASDTNQDETIVQLPVELSDPEGQRTNLNTALEQALQRAAARPLSGVVLLTDGRTDDPPTRSVMRRLQADSVPVFAVPLGSAEPVGDLAIRRVNAPRRAFIHDKVPVSVELDRLGSAVMDLGGTIRLVDQLSGEVLDAIELVPGETRDNVTLIAEPDFPGETIWQVVIDTDQPDLIPGNNIKSINIDLVDRPLRVLLVEGYPRWEYRYVKNLLVREKSIESSVFLISADRDFAQEGNLPITRLPRSPEEFAEFDVIIIGDVPSTFFSPDQLDMIRDHVANRGAGLLWIAGERSTPVTYTGTALADLLPMRGSLSLSPIGEPVNLQPTQLADRLGVLRLTADDGFGWPRELSDPSYRWSQLYYAQKIDPRLLKPTTEVLAETVQEFPTGRLPLVMKMRYGFGQSIYVATDEIWRWRYGRGELYPEQFWVQMIRMLGRESLSNSNQSAVLEVNPRRLEVGQPVRIDLRLLDAELDDERRVSVTVILEDEDGNALAEIELRRDVASPDRYSAIYLPETAGQLKVKLDDLGLPELRLTTLVEVVAPDDELRHPETDHELLEALATSTGGRILLPEDFGELARLLPNRSVRTINPLTERIWDTPLVFLLFFCFLTFEWIGRKALRLV